LICIGDDITDEDMFKQLNSDQISIKVGAGHTVAQYRLNDQPDVRMFLEYLKKQIASRLFHSGERSTVSSSSLLS
jgi:trehalose-phosphatase